MTMNKLLITEDFRARTKKSETYSVGNFDLKFGAKQALGARRTQESVLVFTARRNARIASAVLATAIPSVCLSVCHTPVLCKNDGM